jgi:hypothetical protein
MNRVSLAFRSFFSLLFTGKLPGDLARPAAAAPAPKPQGAPGQGAVELLAVLQRDARLVDFLMEDVAGYSDEQIGAAVRDVQAQARQSLDRHLRLRPVIDAVEGQFTRTAGMDAGWVRFIGNVPASGAAPGGLLRHRGWKAEQIGLPKLPPGSIVAPAEIEVE